MAKARVRWRLTPFSAPINPSVICSIPQLWFCFYLSEVHEKKKGHREADRGRGVV